MENLIVGGIIRIYGEFLLIFVETFEQFGEIASFLEEDYRTSINQRRINQF